MIHNDRNVLLFDNSVPEMGYYTRPSKYVAFTSATCPDPPYHISHGNHEKGIILVEQWHCHVIETSQAAINDR